LDVAHLVLFYFCGERRGFITFHKLAIVETEGFGGSYPSGNTVCIRDWSFMDLTGKKYTPLNGSMEVYKPHKMVWTRAGNGVLAPFYLPSKKQQVNVKVCPSGDTACCSN
jgi:hypothetical protein